MAPLNPLQTLGEALQERQAITNEWGLAYQSSAYRLPRTVDLPALLSILESIIEALATTIGFSFESEQVLRFIPGAMELREVEKEISFVAARLGVDGWGGFDIGALMYALRDVLCTKVAGVKKIELQTYMEWLVMLASESLTKGKIQAAQERWENELDDGTPLIMVTADLPAALFVCCPSRRVSSGIFGRLLLCIVRVGAKAAIMDVSGMSCELHAEFLDPLDSFLRHEQVSNKVCLFVRGSKPKDRDAWKELGRESNTQIILEEYFDTCVSDAIKLGGWRLLPPL